MIKVTDERLGAFTRFQHDIFEKVLKGSLDPQAVEDTLRPLIGQNQGLRLVNNSVVIPALISTFNPEEYFTENKKVRYTLLDNFREHVLDPVKPFSGLQDICVSKHVLEWTMYDNEIRKRLEVKLMSREEILWTITNLTSKQPNGEKGVLLTNGCATIIGYLRCDDGVVRVVFVHFFAIFNQWCCRCIELGQWGADDEVLSRN